jgi:arylsulfatase A-like enzyme
VDKLKELEIYDSSLIIVAGDHGEMLGEHGESEHTYFIYQGAVKVPLIFKLPEQKTSRRIDGAVGLIDIAATLCSMLGIEVPGNMQGEDLSNYFNGDEPLNSSRQLYCESFVPTKYGANPLLGVVNDRYKYIQSTKAELYDLVEDPGEMNNLIQEEAQRGRVLQEHLKEILEQSVRENTDTDIVFNEQALIRLQSLGYVAGNTNGSFEFDDSADDAKDLIEFHESYKEFLYLDSELKFEEAEALANPWKKGILQERYLI